MKKFVIALFSVTVATLSCNAQLLWKITGNNLDKPSYLFGTHHVAPITVLDSVPGFNDALNSVDKVYGELIMSEANTPQTQQIMMQAGMAPQDSTLTAVLTAAQADSLDTMLKKYMGPMAGIAQFNALKPAMVSTVISMVQAQMAFPTFNMQEQLDSEIQNRGAALGKEIGGLETIEEQCQALFGSSIIDQADDLMNMVRNDNRSLEMAHKLAKAYLAGDLNAMLALIEEPEMGMGTGADRLINNRNANWVRFMAGLLPTASVLIAVGAGHLPGDKGLISLLRKSGYTVTPVE